jgi:hypothetical protein
MTSCPVNSRLCLLQQIRASTTRGAILPFWLPNGADVGGESIEPKLDNCLFEVSRLRCDAIAMWRQLKGLSAQESHGYQRHTRDLIKDCQTVDLKLIKWAGFLPLEWKFVIQTLAE